MYPNELLSLNKYYFIVDKIKKEGSSFNAPTIKFSIYVGSFISCFTNNVVFRLIAYFFQDTQANCRFVIST